MLSDHSSLAQAALPAVPAPDQSQHTFLQQLRSRTPRVEALESTLPRGQPPTRCNECNARWHGQANVSLCPDCKALKRFLRKLHRWFNRFACQADRQVRLERIAEYARLAKAEQPIFGKRRAAQ